MTTYFDKLMDQAGAGWNRFWYKPSDACTLGLMRLLTGVVYVYWYLTLIPDLVFFFGGKGLLPLEKIRADATRGDAVTMFSYWDYVSTPTAIWAAYFIGLAVLVCFTVGFYSRISAILSYIVIISFAHRAPMMIGAFEQTLPLLLLGFCIGPCGACFSVDRWLSGRAVKDYPVKLKELDQPSTLATIGLRLIQIHLTLITVAMLVAKLKYGVWWTGGAAWLLIVRPESRAFDFSSLGKLPTAPEPEKNMLFDAWTHMVIIFQILFPITIWNQLLRPLVIAVSGVVWLLIAAVTGMFPFCALMFIATLAFIPGESLRNFMHSCCGGSKPVTASLSK